MVVLPLLAGGLVAGSYGSMVGAGGGFLIVPLLLFLFPTESPAAIAATSLLAVLFSGLSATGAYARLKRIDYRMGLSLAVLTVPGAIAGVYLVSHIPRDAFQGALGLLLVGVGYLSAHQALQGSPRVPRSGPYPGCAQAGGQPGYRPHLQGQAVPWRSPFRRHRPALQHAWNRRWLAQGAHDGLRARGPHPDSGRHFRVRYRYYGVYRHSHPRSCGQPELCLVGDGHADPGSGGRRPGRLSSLDPVQRARPGEAPLRRAGGGRRADDHYGGLSFLLPKAASPVTRCYCDTRRHAVE